MACGSGQTQGAWTNHLGKPIPSCVQPASQEFLSRSCYEIKWKKFFVTDWGRFLFIFSFHVAVETPGVSSSPIMGHRLNATRFYYYNAVISRNKHLIQLSRLKNWHWGSCNTKSLPSPVSVVLTWLDPNIRGCFKERYGKSYSCSLKQHIKGRISLSRQ